MLDFEYILNGIDDNYSTSIQNIQREYKNSLIAAVRMYLVRYYPTFTGNIYFEVNRDFLSVVALETAYGETFKNSEIQQNLHKYFCTLQPNLLQCLDDVQISI